MRLAVALLSTVLAGTMPYVYVFAQGSTEREIEIHSNVNLIEVPLSQDIPEDIALLYRQFVPMFREVLKENTQDQSGEKGMVIRIAPGVKEVGSAKIKRPQASVTAFCRYSRKEYVGSFLLYSYAHDGPVNREETEQFLRRQILEPMECYVPVTTVAKATNLKPEPAASPVEPKRPPVPMQAAAPTIAPPAPPSQAIAPPPTSMPPKPATVESPPPPVPTPPQRGVQAGASSDIQIHRNVYLFDAAPPPEMPVELANQYVAFLSVFREVLRECTSDQSDENRLIMRVAAGMREVGPGRVQRPQARITALVGDANKEYINDFSLYSYSTRGLVGKAEIADFLRRQVLEPLECYSPTIPAAAQAKLPGKPEPVPASVQKMTMPSATEREADIGSATRIPMSQGQVDQEIEIRRNIRLIEFAAPPDLPPDIAAYYHKFLPLFREVLRENTVDQGDKDNLVIRVNAGVREVGSAKIKRPQARVVAFCRGSRREYIGDFILYSYVTNGPVNRQETEQFVRKQVLEPLECYVPPNQVLAAPKSVPQN